MATYTELHQRDPNFELRQWEICGQDFVADLCGCVDVLVPAVAYLVELQGLQVPIWKAALWFPKVKQDLDGLGKLSINSPPECCVHLNSKIDEIKKFTFNGQKLVDGWLITGTDVSHTTTHERSEVVTWEMRQLDDVEKDLQQLASDLSFSLQARYDKCLSRQQAVLVCIDIDSIVNLLVGERKSSGYPYLKNEVEFVEYGKDGFQQFYAYVCSLSHVKQLAENHFTELKLKDVYSDEILTKLKNTLKLILWTPKYVHILSRWLKCITVTDNGQVRHSLIARLSKKVFC